MADKSRSRAQGRCVPEPLGVDKPKPDEIGLVCKFLELDYVVEPKRHPADFFSTGRVRVRLFNDDKTPANPDVPSKRALLLKLGELIPSLKSRTNPQGSSGGGGGKKGGNKKKGPTTGGSKAKTKGGKKKK